MIAYAILKGVRLEALPERYRETGKEIFNGICKKYLSVREDGDLNLGHYTSLRNESFTFNPLIKMKEYPPNEKGWNGTNQKCPFTKI